MKKRVVVSEGVRRSEGDSVKIVVEEDSECCDLSVELCVGRVPWQLGGQVDPRGNPVVVAD